MPLMEPREFVETFFAANSRPSVSTVHRWISRGEIPGRKIGKLVFVDSDAFEAKGNELVEKVLRNVSRAA